MAKIIKQFFDLIDPQTEEKRSGLVIKLEMNSGTKKFIDFHSFLDQVPNPRNILKENMQRKQTINMKVAEKHAEKMLENYLNNKDFKEV